MALESMTGFGRGSADGGGVCIAVELASVNRKQLDFSFSAPSEFAVFESRCQTLVASAVSRGRVQCRIKVADLNGGTGGVYDVDEVRAVAENMEKLAMETGLENDFTLSRILALPDIAKLPVARLTEDEAWRLVETALNAALASLVTMRETEGAALKEYLEARIAALRLLREDVVRLAPSVPLRYKEALERRIAELDAPIPPGDPSLAREVALCADRSDISEELSRLAAHFDHFEELCNGQEPCGRKLDFLCQEIHREINTIGSKANDANIARIVIEMKSALETAREQVQNIE